MPQYVYLVNARPTFDEAQAKFLLSLPAAETNLEQLKKVRPSKPYLLIDCNIAKVLCNILRFAKGNVKNRFHCSSSIFLAFSIYCHPCN